VSANATYRHFPDRAGLLAAVAEAGFAAMEAQMVRALAALPAAPGRRRARERLFALGASYVEFAVAHPELLRVMFGVDGLPALGAPTAPPPAPAAMLGAAVDALVAEGEVPRARRAGAELKLWVVVHGFAALVSQGGVGLQARRARVAALESLSGFSIAGLGGPRRRAPGRARVRRASSPPV
jgi:AcrR family transcriptional regulator